VGDLRGIRLGLPPEHLEGVDPGVRERVLQGVAVLEAAGARVEEIHLPMTPYGIACYYLLCTAEASSNLARYDGVHYGRRRGPSEHIVDLASRTREEGFGAEVKLRILLGTFVLSAGYYDAHYLKASRVRTRIRQEFHRALSEVDGIVGPTSPVTAFPLGERLRDPLRMYLCDALTVEANLAGLPAISVPCGLASGLPVGLQITGRPFGEAEILRMAAALEEGVSFPAHPHPPEGPP
jgi:aspartyl-tRNA(Asn)/glutamyl-tRNA(Gln) amidotransferase subunit A